MINACHYCEWGLISTCSNGLHITCEKTGDDKSYEIVHACGNYRDMILVKSHNDFFLEEEFTL